MYTTFESSIPGHMLKLSFYRDQILANANLIWHCQPGQSIDLVVAGRSVTVALPSSPKGLFAKARIDSNASMPKTRNMWEASIVAYGIEGCKDMEKPGCKVLLQSGLKEDIETTITFLFGRTCGIVGHLKTEAKDDDEITILEGEDAVPREKTDNDGSSEVQDGSDALGRRNTIAELGSQITLVNQQMKSKG
ncbi:hypothetical protein M501DRAFT_1020909 [Patellaria atrata CBS 101060]|uniref:Uncharacterized protein n=1 Tax=Patellaria atrata CBS 101060 TaxID=1346257 RepID=A0A9P4S2C3_9PEZI|nr:hypothetical protein M501DRAFT_1020909 [Patellaria atrata CBS 101060]